MTIERFVNKKGIEKMFSNYIKIAYRNLVKNKMYSFIIITGLCVGITCCLLIALFVKHEIGYDNFQTKKDRIVRVIMSYSLGGNTNGGNYTSTKVGPSFKRNFSEVEEFVRMAKTDRIVKRNDKLFVEKNFLYADSTFFSLFSFPLVAGNEKTALANPNSLVITRSAAQKYFGEEDPIGKNIKISSNAIDYLITGVVEDCPPNSHIKFDFLASFSSLGVSQEETYWNANYTTYLLLQKPEHIDGLQKKIPGFMKKEMEGTLTGNDFLTYYLEPFSNIHLYSDYAGFEPNGSIIYVYIISVIAMLILAIACFTYINLSTAKSVERAREIGIRKVTGAIKSQIFWQFVGESLLISTLSAIFSILLAAILLPYFNELIGRKLELSSLLSANIVAVIAGVILLISFAGGSYPAIILSDYQPVKVLKGAFKNTASGLLLRKSLFVFQFVISIFLIVCAIVIQNQLSYIQHKKLGFEKEHLLVLPFDNKIFEKYTTLKSELKKCNAVLSMSRADFEPSAIVGGYNMSKPGMAEEQSYGVNAGVVDDEYLKTCKIEIITGTDLSEKDIEAVSYPYDSGKNYFHFILNESAARQMGWTPQEAIGKKMFMDGSRPGEVKAVVKDFHFSSVHNPIKPLVLIPGNYGNIILLKISGSDIDNTLATIGNVWKELITHRPFEYKFMEDNYNNMYKAELQLGKAVNVFTVLAILLTCFGLFGLASYNIQQRSKEIGILKIFGASVTHIVFKLSSNFIALIFIAIIIAFPLAWLVMNYWLQNFSYRVSINPAVFIISGLVSVLLAFITISLKSIKAANANPVKSLRTE